MHLKKFVLVFCLVLFGMGFSYGQSDTVAEDNVEFTSEPIIFSNGVKLNILKGYLATNESNSEYLANKLGVASQDEGDIVAVMVPENLAMVPDQPYLVVLYYKGLVISEEEIAKFNPDSLFFELVLNKNANTNVNWIFTQWVDDDVNYDAEIHQLRLNCAYKSKYNIDVKQRQIAYWQFGNQGMYHYVWVCPEDKIAIYPPPMDELNHLLEIPKRFAYNNKLPVLNEDSDLTLALLVGYEDLGSNAFNTNGTNPELEIKDQSEESEKEERAPVLSNNILFMFISNLSFWQLVFLCVVPAFVICMLILYNSSVYEPKEKEVNWDENNDL